MKSLNALTPLSSFQLITTAASFAAAAHATQKRDETGEPYINHPLRVAQMAAALGCTAEFIAAMLLHDVVEDTDVTMKTISDRFPAFTASVVHALSKSWSKSKVLFNHHELEALKSAYYSCIVKTSGAALGKVLDRIDNLNDFARVAHNSETTFARSANYLKKTKDEFPKVLAEVNAPQVHALFDEALQRLQNAIDVNVVAA